MITLRSYVQGRFVEGTGPESVLVNPATEAPIAKTSTGGIDFAAALAHARDVGGPALRALTFAERGELVRAIGKLIWAEREALIGPAIENGGNTRSDAKFDIDGASGTMNAYADFAKALPASGNGRYLVDGEAISLGRSARFGGQHVWSPRTGVAVHVNAFNFPGWGWAEKAAQALLAGMPVITKPATSTALLCCRMIEQIIEARILPEGALSLVAGSSGDLLSHLGEQEVLAFTGSLDTAVRLRATPNFLSRSVHVNVEADSLNAAVLAPDVEPGSATWDLFVSDLVKEMTQKAGQKCTAIRRVLVPSARVDDVVEAVRDRLTTCKVGDPAREEVTMGPLATAQQLADVRAGIDRLAAEATIVIGGPGALQGIGAPEGKGYFVAPTLFVARDPARTDLVHRHEVFGPVATLLPYDGEGEPAARHAAREVARGAGMLLTCVYGDDRAFVAEAVRGIAPWVGRVYLGSAKIAGQAMTPGTALPHLLHGGPGRAGGGEELGGQRGMSLYLQRTALQGDKAVLEALLK